nr:MAG TPA: membrane glycoprotein [Bacteriophage sp.]
MILTFFSADKYGIKSDIWKSFADGFEFFQKELEKYKASLNGAKFSLSDFNTALQQSKAKSLESGEAVDGLTLKLVALRAGAMLLNVALNAIVSTVANFVITKFNEWRTAIETNAQKSKELSFSMTDLISQYKELGDKSGWDTDDFAQAKDLNAEILDLLKNQSAEMDKKLRKLDLENGKYQEQIDLLNELSISTLTQNKADQGKLLEQTAKGKSSGQYVVGDSSDTDMANALGGKFGGSLDSNTGVFNFGGFDPNDADSILAYYDKLSNALDYLGSNYDSATLEASSLYNQLKSEKNAIEDQANAYRSSSDTLKEVVAAQKLSSTSSKRSEEDIKAVTDALEGLKGAYGGITSGNLVNFLSGDKKLGGTYADALNQLKEVMLNLGFDDNASDAQAFVDVLVQLGIVSSSSASKVDGLSESASSAADQLKEATDGLDKIQSAYSTLSDVVDEYNENGYLTVSTLTDLINLGPEYYDCLVDESGQLAINTENINTMADAYYEMAKAALYAQAIESLNANTNTYANASKFLSQAQQEVKDMKSLLYAEGQRLIDAGGLSGDALATQVQAQNRIINTYSTMMDLLDKTHAQSAENQFRNPKDKSSNKSSGSEDKMTDAVSAWKTLSAAMEEYNQYGNLCISTLNDLLGLEDDYTSLLTEQNGKMSINTTKFKNLMFAQIAQANATDESGKSAAELKRILQYVDENVKGDTISFEQLTDAIEGYGTAMDKAKQKTDAIKSAFSGLAEVSKNKIDSPFGALDADGVDKQYQAIRDLYDNTDLFTDDRFAEALNPETGLVDYDSDAFKQMFLEKLDGMATACEETGGKAGKYLAQGFRDAEDKIKNNVISIEEYINGIGSTLESINNRMDNFQSAFNDLTDIVDEYNAYGDLSQDSIQKLMALDIKYVGCLELQGDKLVFNKEAFKELYIAELKELALKYEGTEIGKRYADILQKVADGTWDVTDHMKGMGEEANRLNTIISNLKDLFSSLLDLVNNANDKKSNDLKIQGDAWIDVIDKRIDALNEENDAQERAIELAKLQAELEKAETQKTARVYTSNGYEWQADESAVREARNNLNDKIRENRKQDEIDKLTKLKEEIQKNIDLIDTS